MKDEDIESIKKKVDESWKEAVTKEKAGGSEGAERHVEATFNLFITGLMMEALVALGEVEHPVTKAKEKNEPHAKFVIDTLSMLRDKTRNNLTKDESDMLDSILYDLRMRFVKKVNDGK